MSLHLYQYYVVTKEFDNTLEFVCGPFATFEEASECKRESFGDLEGVCVFEACLEGRCI